tara:strand:- start:208 stop:849 length:642 start_codon:yes stop_codon:yes gene_type:complete
MALNERDRLTFETLLREYDSMRQEELVAMQHIRKLPITATYFAGFAFPVIAGILTTNFTSDKIDASTFESFRDSIASDGEICALLCLAVAYVCMTLVYIYLGSFKQLMNIAHFIEYHVHPEITKLVGEQRKVLYWETWLNRRRQEHWAKAGDIYLKAEPIVIFFYVLIFCAMAAMFAHAANFVPTFFYASAGACAVLSLGAMWSFWRALNPAD